MDYRHLKYFMEVAEEKSFSKAARNLHISQSAISRMIKSLEDELGIILFIRNAKTVEITAPGSIFLNYAKRCLFAFEHLKSDFENEFNLKKDTIQIGLPPITDAHVFAKLLGEFKKTYPQISIELYEDGSKVIETSVQEGRIASSAPFRIKILNRFSCRMIKCASSCRKVIRWKREKKYP